MKRGYTYRHTICACFIGYIVQAIVNNFAPMLFLTFQETYGIPIQQVTLLITVNFGVQLLVDLFSAAFVDKIGYRRSLALAHGAAAAGLLLLAILPNVLSKPFVGILMAVVIYAIGGGLIEVLVSPVVEACPTENKEKMMSLLHSFYCWGSVGVVLLSTLFFAAFGIRHWMFMAVIWALIPLGNIVLLAKVPLYALVEDGTPGLSVKELLRNKMFWVLVVMMACAGASEQGISQWASAYAESALGVPKTVGDLAGPCVFSICMGLSRLWYGKAGETMNLRKFMAGCSVLCIGGYLMAGMPPAAVIGFLGCAVGGFSVGIMWPGTFSIASACLERGGTSMFALLALAGDLGCSLGPTAVGIASGTLGGGLKTGLLCGIIFPVGVLACMAMERKIGGKIKNEG